MNGFDFQQLAQRVAGFASGVIEGPTWTGGRTQISFPSLYERATQLALRMRSAGLAPGELVAMRSVNCVEWVIWDLACVINGQVMHVFLEDLAQPAASEVHARYGYRLIVDALAVEPLIPGVCHLDDQASLQLAVGQPVVAADPEVFSMVYSSGSSGEPKGLKISRKGTEFLINQFLDDYPLDETDRSLMFMPLSNFQQRMSMYAFLWTGTSFALTDLDNAFVSARDFAPSYMVAPPSFYEQALQRYPGPPQAHDSLKNGLGGALRFVHVGMAPSTGDPIGRFRAQGIAMYEAYGVTEAGMVAWNTPKASRAGSVGRPVDPAQVYLSSQGEVMVRRPYPLCLGYFEASQNDQDSTFRQGEIATGDLGEFDEDGFLFLRGRIKNQVVLVSGKRFLAETVERAVRQAADLTCCVALFDGPRQVLQCYVVPASGRLADTPAETVRDAILLVVGQPLAIEVIGSTVLPGIESGTLTRNMKIRRAPMAAWIATRLADADPTLRRTCFKAEQQLVAQGPFIDHLPTIKRIDGYSYLVIRIVDASLVQSLAAVQATLRERLQGLTGIAADQTLLPVAAHLTLGEWHGYPDVEALACVVERWAQRQGPLQLHFEGLQATSAASCLLLASVRADPALREALRGLRSVAREMGLPCVEQVAVEDWLFHVSLAHCPGLSTQQWQSMLHDVPLHATASLALRTMQVELVHYRDARELPAAAFALQDAKRVAP